MTVVPKIRWWGITALTVVFIGNSLEAALWFWAIFSTPAHTHARYIIEAGLSFLIGGVTFVLALPFIITGFVQPATRSAAAVSLLLAFTPIPLGISLMHALSAYRQITLSP